MTGRAAARHQRGAALLLAMAILTLITTLAAGMVWQQYRAIQVEAAERARVQSAWILSGALDWARLILREDAKAGGTDHLGEPWAVPLAEARLSSFLAADRDNNADDGSGPDAFLSGSITDAQSRYNLRNLVKAGEVVPEQLEMLERLCQMAGLPPELATQIADNLRTAWTGGDNALVAPDTVERLVWLGVPQADLQRLTPWTVLLPVVTPVNINTAPREVIAAVSGLDLALVERLIQTRQREPFKTLAAASTLVTAGTPLKAADLGTNTAYFEVLGQVRLGDRLLRERSLVRRNGLDVQVVQRERVGAVVEGP